MVSMTATPSESSAVAYFHRIGATTFRATEHVGGGWNPAEQHVAPSLGLLAHAIETDRDARRDDALQLGRVSYDILGTFPIGEIDVTVTVLRPGRTIELVEARLSHGGRDAVIARGWLMDRYSTEELAGTGLESVDPPSELPQWNGSEMWPGGFIASIKGRRTERAPGRATAWITTELPLIEGEPVSPTARLLGLVDVMNGVATRADNTEVSFPNLDLTAHLFREPVGPWVGLDTSVSFGPTGLGLTHAVIHDDEGPVGAVSQCLTVRPGN